MSERIQQRLTSGTREMQAARAQLTLVEHALCPLDVGVSLQPGFRFETQFAYSDRNRNRKQSRIQIAAIDGLSAHDELYLWGLLSIALSQKEQRPEFMATPYFCLRRLGLINEHKGGREFELFRAAIKRLAGVRYQSDAFYDPIRGEHRAVSFGFLNYSLPLGEDSHRAWRFAWDPIFFELAQATGGTLAFDLSLYRELTPAARRLYLFLKKLFWRSEMTPRLDLRQIAIEVLGFASHLETSRLRQKVGQCIEQLVRADFARLPAGVADAETMFRREGPGRYLFELHRGPRFNPSDTQRLQAKDSPLFEPLKSIGFDEMTIARLIGQYSARLLEEWSDITLAAMERKLHHEGKSFFTKSPMAYFMSNIKEASAGRRTPPDWWRDLRKHEREIERQQECSKLKLLREHSAEADFDEYLRNDARDEFMALMERLSADLRTSGQSEHDARTNAEYMARIHLQNRFRRTNPERQHGNQPVSLRDYITRS